MVLMITIEKIDTLCVCTSYKAKDVSAKVWKNIFWKSG